MGIPSPAPKSEDPRSSPTGEDRAVFTSGESRPPGSCRRSHDRCTNLHRNLSTRRSPPPPERSCSTHAHFVSPLLLGASLRPRLPDLDHRRRLWRWGLIQRGRRWAVLQLHRGPRRVHVPARPRQRGSGRNRDGVYRLARADARASASHGLRGTRRSTLWHRESRVRRANARDRVPQLFAWLSRSCVSPGGVDSRSARRRHGARARGRRSTGGRYAARWLARCERGDAHGRGGLRVQLHRDRGHRLGWLGGPDHHRLGADLAQ